MKKESAAFPLHHERHPERGAALVIAVGIVVFLSLIGFAISRLVENHSRAGGSNDELQEIEMLRKTLLDYTDCRNTIGLKPGQAYAACDKNPKILKDRSGQPLFPLKGPANETQVISTRNPAGQLQEAWEIRAFCDDDLLVVEKRQLGLRKASLFSNWGPLWPESARPDFCRAYFTNENGCGGDYPVLAGTGPDERELCCRGEESISGVTCRENEYLLLGGAICAPANQMDDVTKSDEALKRCYPSDTMFFDNLTNGSARGITMTSPSMNMIHTDQVLPALMEARATYPKTKTERNTKWEQGGFLLQSGYASLNKARVIDSWVATCRINDWETPRDAAVRGYCCPKKPRR